MDIVNRAMVQDASSGLSDQTYWVEQAEALGRLEMNEDFRKVIIKGYFQDKAVHGVSLLATDELKRAGARTDVMEALVAISALEDHFKTIKALGFIVKDDMMEAELEGEDDN